MVWLLFFVRQLALTLWLGGLLVIDFLETPIRFRVPEVNRNQVVAIGRRVFAALNKMEAGCGVVLLVVETLLLPRFPLDFVPKEQLALAAIVLMWGSTLLQMVWVRPRMTAITRGLDLVNRNPEDTRFAQVGRLHKVYSGLDFLKMALGLIALGLWNYFPTR